MTKLIAVALSLLFWMAIIFLLLYPINILAPFWLFVTLALVYVSIFARVDKKKIDTLNPILVFPLILFLYCYAGLEYFGENSTVFLGYVYLVSEESILTFALCSHIGLLAVAWSALLFRTGGRSHEVQPPFIQLSAPENILLQKNIRLICALLVALSGIFVGEKFIKRIFPIGVDSYANRAFELRLEIAANPVASVVDVLIMEPAITLLLVVCALTVFNRESRPAWKLISVALIGSFLLTSALTGFRFWLIYGLIIIITTYHYTVRNISLIRAAFGCLFVFFLMNFLSFTRNYGSLLDLIPVLLMIDSSLWIEFFQLANSSELQTSTILPVLLSGINDATTSFNYGMQYLYEIAVFIPRLIWSDRPLTIAEQFAQTFDPATFESGGGFGAFILIEGYWAAGLIGVFLSIFSAGYLIQYVHMRFESSRTLGGLLFFGFFYLFFAIISVRSGFFGGFKGYLSACVPFFYLFMFQWALTGRWLRNEYSVKVEKGRNTKC